MGQSGYPGGFLKALVMFGIIGGVFMWPFHSIFRRSAELGLLGHSDIQGRNSLQIVLKGNFAYMKMGG